MVGVNGRSRSELNALTVTARRGLRSEAAELGGA